MLNRAAAGVAFVSVVLMAVAPASGGPLSPPAGPVTPTGKTLTEVEPRRALSAATAPGDADSILKITEPGSYYLAHNVVGQPGKHGIEIAAGGVTVDLNGFDLVGVPGSLDGITVTAEGGVQAVSVVNGTVRSWDGDGVDLSAGLPIDGVGVSRVERVRVHACGGVGIRVNNYSAVVGCTVVQTGSHGLSVGFACTIAGCEIGLSGSGGVGSGIRSEGATIVTGCNIFRPTGHGIECVSLMTIDGCAVFDTGGDGIQVGQRSLVTRCSVGNAGGSGIVVDSRSAVESCLVHVAGLHGISAGDGSTVRSCTALLSGEHGIAAEGRGALLWNLCRENGATSPSGAGIRVLGERCRLEGNTINNNPIGIALFGTNNIALRNTCSANSTNWSVWPLNVCHVLVAAVNSLTFSGNSGGTPPGGTDPNVNYTH